MSDIPIAQIVITRTLLENGHLGFTVQHTPKSVSFVETLGLLDAARWRVYEEMTRQYRKDCDD